MRDHAKPTGDFARDEASGPYLRIHALYSQVHAPVVFCFSKTGKTNRQGIVNSTYFKEVIW